MSRLLARPYWTRAWIVQELAVSKDVVMIYGADHLKLSIVLDVIELIWGARGGDTLIKEPWKRGEIEKGMVLNYLNIKVIAGFRRLLQQNMPVPLRDAVEATWFFKATDPRDKLYAFCAIATHPDGEPERIDYGMSPQDLYTQFAARSLKSHLAKFLFAAGLSQPRNLPNLPSWVPDLSSVEQVTMPQKRGGPRMDDRYCTGGDRAVPLAPIIDNNRLHVAGIIVDHIAHLTQRTFERTWHETYEAIYSPALAAWHDEAAALVVAHILDMYRTSRESRRDAFIRTLIADRGSDGREATQSYRKHYSTWRRHLSATVSLDGDAPGETSGSKDFASAVVDAVHGRRLAVTAGDIWRLCRGKRAWGTRFACF